MNLTDSRKFALLQAAAVIYANLSSSVESAVSVAEELLSIIEQRERDRKYVPADQQ